MLGLLILLPSLDFSRSFLKIESRGKVFVRCYANCWVLVFHRHVYELVDCVVAA